MKLLLWIALFWSVPSHAVPGKSHLLQSGRDEDVLKLNQDAVQEVNKAAELLGIAVPPHQLEFLPSSELAKIAVNGRPNIGHWYDGSQVVTQATGAMGVLEFVTPGNPTCRSFYSDSTSSEHQIEIFKHVIGHNDFSSNSVYNLVRQPYDVIAASHRLFDLMEMAYRDHNFDEVAQWYQFLLSLSFSQEVIRGSFESPESFIRQSKTSLKAHPENPTPHELQFLVKNLPAEFPQWKKDIAEAFEEMLRNYGFGFSTKIMNEGWATFVQDLLVPYLPWQDDHHLIESAILKTEVSYPDLSNPYWLGREAWKNLYQNFKKKKEVENLSSLEKDQAFVKFAHEIMATHGDYDFLRRALDQGFLNTHHLFLYRKAKENEQDPNLGYREGYEQKIVVSTGQAVIDFLAKKRADFSVKMPRVLLEDMATSGKNVYSLVHEMIEDIPLHTATIPQALYIRAQIWARPVSLKLMTPSSLWGSSNPIKFHPARFEVDPGGTVQFFVDNQLHPSGTEYFQEILDSFKEDLDGTLGPELEEAQKKKFAPLLSSVVDKKVEPVMSSISHSMSSSTAVLRYMEMVERRLYRSISRAQQGKSPFQRTQKGVRLRVLPDIPDFHLDLKTKQAMDRQKLSLQGMQSGFLRVAQSLMDLVETRKPDQMIPFSQLDIGKGKTQPREGDRFLDKSDDEQSGQGEGEGEEGDEDDESPDHGNQPGRPQMDPKDIEIPLEVWGEFLKESIELPRIRPLVGQSDRLQREKEGSHPQTYGDVLWHKVVPKALVLGALAEQEKEHNASSLEKGSGVKRGNYLKVLKEGMRRIQPEDWIVADHEETFEPDMNAVIVFWMDMTGSMSGEPIAMAKKFMFNLKALLSTKYKRLEFRYVGFADQAKEFATEAQFFRQFLNGATNYASGIRKTMEVLSQFPVKGWDRYTFGIGDAEDQNSKESSEVLTDLIAQTQYSAFIRTDIDGNYPDPVFLSTITRLSEDDPYFGYAVLEPKEGNAIEVIRKVLGKNRSE